MPFHFLSGKSDKQYNSAIAAEYQKAVVCAKTFDWEELPLEGDKTPEWPKQFKCKKTGIVATRLSPKDPVMFVKDEYLLLTADEVIVKDIIT